jgi:hypothetical protein
MEKLTELAADPLATESKLNKPKTLSHSLAQG